MYIIYQVIILIFSSVIALYCYSW